MMTDTDSDLDLDTHLNMNITDTNTDSDSDLDLDIDIDEETVEIEEKYAVVLDLGSAWWKCGIAGESMPRHVCRAPCDLLAVVQNDHDHIGGETTARNILRSSLSDILINTLLVTPSQTAVTLVEDLLWPQTWLNAILSALFIDLQVISVSLISTANAEFWSCLCPRSGTLSAFDESTTTSTSTPSSGSGSEPKSRSRSYLVVDIGFGSARCVPVVDSVALTFAMTESPFCGLQHLKRLYEHEHEHSDGNGNDGVKIKPSFAFEAFCSKIDLTSINMSKESEVVRKWIIGNNEPNTDSTSLATLILDSLLLCDADSRALLGGSVLLVGGGSEISGIGQIVLSDVRRLLKHKNDEDEDTDEDGESGRKYHSLAALSDYFVMHTCLLPGTTSAWCGASILTSVGDAGSGGSKAKSRKLRNRKDATATTAVITRRMYAARGYEAPDWTCVLGREAYFHFGMGEEEKD